MKIYILSFLLSVPAFAQVGVWNPKPQGVLDINRPDGKNIMGLVLPLIDKVEASSTNSFVLTEPH